MKQALFLKHLALVALAIVCLPAFGQGSTPRPERPTKQEAVYDATNQAVIITALAPSTTEYDWDNYVQYDLTEIDYIAIKRHEPGTPWPTEELGRVVSPAVGAQFQYVDNTIETDKQYEYSLTVYVGALSSQQAYARVYTGITPGPVSAFTATTADYLTNAVDFTVTAPDTSATGEPLQGPFTIRIQQENGIFSFTDVHDIENVEPGKTYTWKYENLQMNKAYTFVAFALMGSEGKGATAEASTYVGLDYPGMPQNFTCVSNGEEATISWEQPATGRRGGNYNPEATTYTLKRIYLDGSEEEVARNINGTAYTDRPDFDEETAIGYKLVAVNATGESPAAKHDAIVVGKPVALPFSESFTDTQLQHKGWITQTTQNDPNYTYKAWSFDSSCTLYYYPTDEMLTVEPQDGDSGMASCIFYGYCKEGQTESLISPHFDIHDAESVTMDFYYWFVPADGFKNELNVSISRNDGAWESIFSSINETGEQPEWRKISLPLNVNSGDKSIRAKFDGIFHGTAANVIIDNINVDKVVISGVEHVEGCDENTATDVYTLSGVKVNDMNVPGIYIVRKSKTVNKVIVK